MSTANLSSSPKKWMMILVVLLAILLVLLIPVIGWGISTNNQLIVVKESMNAAWAQVETVLQRRFDLIPNLVATVKGYAEHEKELLENVTRLRSQWGTAKTVDEKAKAAGELEGTLSRLLVVAEQYPDLKANQNFADLQVELAGTENRIAVERQRYNDSVRSYNTLVQQFPQNLVAWFRGMAPSTAYFEAAKEANQAPKVDFSSP